MIRAALLLPLVIAVPALAAGPLRETKHVEVNGKKYRVTIVADSVLVANKSSFVAYNVYERDDQREAVVKATGCKVVDELPSNDARLRGKLAC